MKNLIEFIDKNNFNIGIFEKIRKSTIEENKIVVIKKYKSDEYINIFIDKLQNFERTHTPAFYPINDSCPDYHRYNDEYPNSIVKAKVHTFKYNLWLEQNEQLITDFKDIFELKASMGGLNDLQHLKNKPSQGFVARVDINHYPIGGGYMSQHIDAVNKFNPIQTLISGTTKSKEYTSGGVYAVIDNQKIFLDDFMQKGDLLIFDQSIPHGVDYIDADKTLDWSLKLGRVMIIPVLLPSEYIQNNDLISKQVYE